MKGNKGIILIVLLFVISGLSHCADTKDFIFRHLTEENGLTNSHIHCIEQDAQGFIWIGTEYGLYRYNGQQFKHYVNYPGDTTSISSNLVLKLYRDSKNTLWVGTFMGIQKYDEDYDRFVDLNLSSDYRDGIPFPVHAITEDPEGGIIVATDDGIAYIDQHTLQTSFIFSQTGEALFQGTEVTAYYIDQDGNHWLGTNEGVDKINQDTEQQVTHFYLTDNNGNRFNICFIHQIFQDSYNNIWVTTRDEGVFFKSDNTEKFIQYSYQEEDPHSLGSNETYDIFENADRDIYITTNGGGINIYNRELGNFTRIKHLPNNKSGLLNNNVRSLMEDRQGNLWIVSFQAGVNIIINHPRLFQHYDLGRETDLDYQSSTVCSIFQDDNGDLWIGTDGGGLKLYDRQHDRIRTFLPDHNNSGSFPDEVVMSIFKDKKGILWFGTYQGGLVKQDKKSGKFIAYRNNPSDDFSIPSNFVTALLEDRNGNFWVGTNGGGVNLFERKKNQFISYINNPDDPNSIVDDYINDILEDYVGNIWIATFWGLSRWNRRYQTFTNFQRTKTQNNSLSDNSVFCLCQDSENRLWVGTRNGLNLFVPESGGFELLTDQDGLSGNTIYSILEDDKGKLWISTNRGLTQFDPESRHTINFSESDGLQGNEFYRNSCFKAADGEMFFGGINGFNSFYPSDITTRYYIPNLIITGFKILEKEIPVGKLPSGRTILERSIDKTETVILKQTDKAFSLELTAIDFITPNNIVYAYKLEGFDENWNYTGAKYPIITYTNLSAGEYNLQIKAANKNIIDDIPISKTLKIRITPPFYKTWWAFTLYVFIFLSISFYFWRLSIQRVKERNLIKMEKLRHEKAEEIQQAKLRFFTNVSHEFRTPLTLIMGPLEQMLTKRNSLGPFKRQLDIMLLNARRMLRLINQILDIRKIEGDKMRLKAEYSDIVKFLKDIVHSFEEYALEKRINLKFNTGIESFDLWFEPDKLDKILFNLLSNSFKFTPEEGEISVEFNVNQQYIDSDSVDGKYVMISVCDSGPGIPKEELPNIFERFYQGRTNENYNQGSGLGLALTKSFIDLHQGQILIDSAPNKGTSIHIYLPEGDSHLQEDEKITSDSPAQNKYIHISPEAYKSPEESKPEILSEVVLSKPNVLIVEDNIELLSYLEDSCSEHYNTFCTTNGKEAFELAVDMLPDLILSDVVMPEMDGFEFCRRIKNNILTSHIPVVLLTAKSTTENQIEGFEAGADSYIAKPFRIDQLIATVDSIIVNRIRLREKFSSGKIQIGQPVKNTSDDKFLQKVIDLVNTNIAEQNFGVSELGKSLGISRVHLHRKLKAIANLSPNEFIRNIRMQKAGELLLEQEYNVSEVCYKVGFNSPAYFSSCFKQHYRLSPSEFMERISNV